MFVHLGKYFQSDPPAEPPAPDPEPDPTKGDPPANWSEEQQKEFDKRAKALKKAAEDEGKKKALAEFEANRKAEQDKAEKERLASEGKFKEASEIAENDKNLAIKRAEEAETRAKELELKDLFNTHVSDKEISFANPQARLDAFAKLDREKVTDAESMEEALSAMQKTHSHYFGVASQNGNTDAGKTGKKVNNTKKDEREREAELKARYNIRPPR